jgi:hypothetical protein
MTTATRSAVLLAALALIGTAPAADPAKPPQPAKTMMVTPGKALVIDDLAGPPGKEWKVAKGKWEATDGAVRGAELPADMHGAVARRTVTMKDVVVEYSFRTDGAKQTTLSFNGAKGHVCRVAVRPTGIAVQKDDQDGKTGPDKPAQLGTADAAVKPGAWHTLVVELRGPDILATLDGTHTAFGSHPALDVEKTNLGFTVAGESVSFKNLRVWEAAGVARDWDATKAKLLAAQKK